MTPRNKPPKAVTDVYSATEDTALNVAAKGVLGNDIDTNGDALTPAVETGPTKGTLTLNADGSFRYTPNANFSGKDSFTYRASDGIAADLGKVTINVAAVNDAPTATTDSYSTSPGTKLTVPTATGVLANDTDPDSRKLTAQLVSGPVNGTLR